MRAAAILIASLLLWPAGVQAQLFHIDSVAVDSVWNSDSTGRVSRDCRLNFFPAGLGTARCTVAVSFDGAATWFKPLDSVSIINSPGTVLACGQRATVRLRFIGADRNNIAFKVTGRQVKPVFTAAPAAVLVGSPFSPPAPGADTVLNVRLTAKTASNRGYAPIAKTYWDFNNDGVFSDSTDSLKTSWTSPAFSGAAGKQVLLAAKVRDANGLWSAPVSVLVQYGLRRPLAMTAISGGSFTMGYDSGAPAEIPAHRVTVSPFSLLTTEITNECFLLLTNSSPLASADSALAPARNMTWFDAVLFCNTLSKRRGLDTCYTYTGTLPSGTIDNSLACDFSKSGYRLPAEAEWEYACRAGSTTHHFWGNAPDTAYAWMYANSGGNPHQVATRLPNTWGLYDMSGNVSEWVNDVYVPYTAGPQTDPRGTTYGIYHTQRGGSAATSAVTGENVSSTIRDNGDASLAYYYNGFRVAAKQ